MSYQPWRIAVVGSRDWPDAELVRRTMEIWFVGKWPVEVVSGGARGVDTMAAEAAVFLGCDLKVFPADWNQFGRSAGYRRNAQMASYCDEVLAFWDGKSKGTGHMIDLALKAGKPVQIMDPSGKWVTLDEEVRNGKEAEEVQGQ